MDLEDIMVTEICQHKKTNTMWSHLNAVSKTETDRALRHREHIGSCQSWGVGSEQNGWKGSKCPNSSYKLN